MEELIEVKLTRRELAFVTAILGSTPAFGHHYADSETFLAGDGAYDKVYEAAQSAEITVQGNVGPDGKILFLSKEFTVKDV